VRIAPVGALPACLGNPGNGAGIQAARLPLGVGSRNRALGQSDYRGMVPSALGLQPKPVNAAMPATATTSLTAPSFPRPDYSIAIHDSALYPAGSVAIVPGYALANVDMVDVTI
jgi:hypothetical protein